MKKILTILITILTVFSFSSCLNSGLEALPEYGDADILSVDRVEHRYYVKGTTPAQGDQLVKNATLSHDAKVDKTASTVAITVTVPNSFPEAELSNLKNSELVVVLNLSPATRLTPLDGSATLGIPADWSKANTYSIKAADGTTKVWTVTLTLNR